MGSLFAASLGRALLGSRGWRLDQIDVARFELHAWERDHFYELGFSARHRRVGELGAVMTRRKTGERLDQYLQTFGIPAGPAQEAAAGELALRLFRANGQAHIALSLDFRPWAPARLRYRLFYGLKDETGVIRQRSIHAPSFEAALIAGLELLHSAG